MSENKARVLIVDDEKEIAVIFAFLLTQHGFYTDIANSGAEALEKFSERKFDYVVSDVRMPVMNGAELFNKVDSLYANPPKFIFISGFEDLLDQKAISKALGRFSKPVDHNTIVDLILEDLAAHPEQDANWLKK